MPPPLVGEALAEDSFFDRFAFGSKTTIFRRGKTSRQQGKL